MSLTLENIIDIVKEFAPTAKASSVGENTRLLHDLLISGDDVLSLWHRIDPNELIDMGDFNISEYFPSELSRDAFLITVLKFFGREHSITKKYKAVTVSNLYQTCKNKRWTPN